MDEWWAGMFKLRRRNVIELLLFNLLGRSETGPFILPSMVSVAGSYPNWANDFSWNSIAHEIYVEFPGGVGFSTKPDNLP